MYRRLTLKEKGSKTIYSDIKSKTGIIPDWILRHLATYGNCAGVKDIVRSLKKESFLKALKQEGFNCELRIIPHEKTNREYPIKATYIVEIKDR